MSYDLSKEYSSTKISKQEGFMKRMLFDITKRQTKQEKLEKMIDKNKLKLSEHDRIQAFNRLIEDANRRLEASDSLDLQGRGSNVNGYQEGNKGVINKERWDKVYKERFMGYKEEKDRDREQKIIEREKGLKENEDAILERINESSKKVSRQQVQEVVTRLYKEAERRQIIKEAKDEEVARITGVGKDPVITRKHIPPLGNEVKKRVTKVSLHFFYVKDSSICSIRGNNQWEYANV